MSDDWLDRSMSDDDYELESYRKIFHLGRRETQGIFQGTVIVQEKLDGSQISFGWNNEELVVRSRGKVQYDSANGVDVADKMFAPLVAYLESEEFAQRIKMTIPNWVGDGLVFRGEWFSGPRQNTLTYGRRPKNGVALFDFERNGQIRRLTDIFALEELRAFAFAFGFEAATVLYQGPGYNIGRDDLDEWLKLDSQLGDAKIEGVVVKNYEADIFGKFVSEEFQEKHKRSWKKENPTPSDIVESIAEALNTPARFQKAVQHLRENGELTETPRDIGALMVEIKRDTLEEETAWITEELVKFFLPKITRKIGRGLPEWYKAELTEDLFDASSA